jgi:hypothetical protein
MPGTVGDDCVTYGRWTEHETPPHVNASSYSAILILVKDEQH